MVNAQEWLDKNYSKEKRNEIREVHLNEPNLEGELDLGDFIHKWGLRIKFYIASSVIDKTKLRFKNKPKKVKIVLQNPLGGSIWNAWEEIGLTYQEAQQWILIGFESKDYNEVKKWKNNNFAFQEVKAWADIGLDKRDIEFASYLRWKGYQSSQNLNLEEAGEEFNRWLKKDKSAQEYLDVVYPKEKRNTVKRVDVSRKGLIGSLDLSDFVNLEKLECFFNQLTTLNLNNCLKLKLIKCSNNQLIELKINNLNNLSELRCNNNQLTSLDVSNCNQLEELRCDDNYLESLKFPSWPKQLTNLRFSSNNFPKQDLSALSHLVSLKELYLGNWDKEKINQGIYNRFIGSLEPLKNLSNLAYLDISNTDINSGVEYLPDNWSFKKYRKVFYSFIERPESRVKEIEDKLTNLIKYGLCKNCQKIINEFNKCEKCNNINNNDDKDSKDIDYFIQKYEKLKSISYEQFEIEKDENKNNIILGEGGFSKVYKAKWINENKIVALKVLNNSQHINEEFLQEIANHQTLFNCNSIVKCYGISQNPISKNYIMVMEYIEGGNLRKLLKSNQLSFEEKLGILLNITWGLNEIHKRNLTHCDLHSGNILAKKTNTWKNRNPCCITDLGLCRPANETNGGKIYGVLPYVAPEVLQGQPYTQSADIYSLGIVTYELFANSYPYPKMDDMNLALVVCQGLRPNLDKVIIPQLLKDLIEKCWDADPKNRPKANELIKIERKWLSGTRNDKNTEFTQQYQEAVKIEKQKFCQIFSKTYKEYKGEIREIKSEEIEKAKKELFEEFRQRKNGKKNVKSKVKREMKKEFKQFLVNENNLGYKNYTSHLLNFKNLPKPQNSKEINEQFYKFSSSIEFNSEEFNQFLEKENQQESQVQDELTKKMEKLAFEDFQTELIQINDGYFSQPLFTTAEINQINWEEIEPNYQNLHPNFTSELTQNWQDLGFTFNQTRDWINVNSPSQQAQAIQEPHFYAWLRDEVKITPQELLNELTAEEFSSLREQFQELQLQSHQELPPRGSL